MSKPPGEDWHPMEDPDSPPPRPPEPPLHHTPVRRVPYDPNEPPTSARTFAALCHLSAIGVFLVPIFGHILFPLAFWLFKRRSHPFVDHHGKEAVNFQITVTFIMLAAGLLFLRLRFAGLLIVLMFFTFLTMAILAGIRAAQGHYHQYPFSLRILR